jgi:class 3 adenylate cyclase/tetratricopeptide (TPR) repeat protein
MGLVFEAEHLRLDRPVAVKVLRPEFVRQSDAVARFCTEARTAGGIDHDGIVRILDVNSEPDGTWYIVMERLRGKDLASELARCGPFPLERAVGIALQVCEALTAAHRRGVVHRDVKPANVFLVARDDGRDRIKLLDFGISKLVGSSAGMTATGGIVGTPLYMSPEQACADPSLDHRADVFGAGAMLYEMLTGHTPFEAPTPIAVLARLMTREPHPVGEWQVAVPSRIEAILRRCLARDPDRRFPDASALAEALAGGGAELPPAIAAPDERPVRPDEMRVVTVLFVTFAEDAPAAASTSEDAVGDLDAVTTAAATIVQEQGGSIQRRFADGLMAVFGAPEARGDDAVRAARAALQIRERCRLGGGDVSMRAGLSTGRVVLGRMRGVGDSGYGIVGQSVAIARRIEGMGREGSVAICRETLLQIRGRFRTQPIRAAEDAEDAAAPSMHEVIEELPHGLLLPPREILGVQPRLVGREVEYAQAVAAFGRAVEERGLLVLTLVGPPGIGKSRLAHELRCHVESIGIDVMTLVGRPDGPAGTAPLGVWANLLRSKAGIPAGVDPDAGIAKLRGFLRYVRDDDPATAERHIPALGALLGLREIETCGATLRDGVLAALTEVLRYWAARFPIFLVLDDLQWADPSSLELLGRLLPRLSASPVFVLALARPEPAAATAAWIPDPECHVRVDLRPLSRRACVSLAREILGDGLDDDLLERIAQRGAGTPLFIEEIARMLADRGVLVREGRSWRTAGSTDTLDIPLTVEAVLQARLDELPADERDTLRRAAVAGEVFWDGALEALGVPTPGPTLALLAAKDLVRAEPSSRFEGRREYAFRHALVRDVAYAATPPRERRTLHHTLAAWILARGGDAVENHALCARHFEAAECHADAAAAMVRAGLVAAKSRFFLDARRYFEQAIGQAEAAGDDDLLLLATKGLGQTLATNAEHRMAEPILRHAVEMADRTRESAPDAGLLLNFAHNLAALGRRDEALAMIDRAEAIVAGQDDAKARAELEKDKGIVYFILRDLDRAVGCTARAAELAAQADLPYIRAVCIHNLADVDLRRGNLADAAAGFGESLALCERHGFRRLLALNSMFLGHLAVIAEQRPEGIEAIREGLRFAEERGCVWDLIQGTQLLATALRHLGRLDEAVEALERAVELARQTGNEAHLSECRSILEEIRAERAADVAVPNTPAGPEPGH